MDEAAKNHLVNLFSLYFLYLCFIMGLGSRFTTRDFGIVGHVPLLVRGGHNGEQDSDGEGGGDWQVERRMEPGNKVPTKPIHSNKSFAKLPTLSCKRARARFIAGTRL